MRDARPLLTVPLIASLAIGALAACAHPARDAGDALLGRTVRDLHGARVGTVRDLEHDGAGAVKHVVIGLGPVLGGGERYVVVPWEHFAPGPGGPVFRGARERLIDAPRRAPQ